MEILLFSVHSSSFLYLLVSASHVRRCYCDCPGAMPGKVLAHSGLFELRSGALNEFTRAAGSAKIHTMIHYFNLPG